MSRADFKPVPCKQGCGKDVIWERDTNGKWLPPFEFDVENWVKLNRHMCPNYKPQAKPFEKRGQGTNWAGTNKQGQMFEARESKEIIKQEIQRVDEIITKLDELIGLCRETLITVKTKPDAHQQEPKEEEETERKEDEYGF